ncbi:MAG: hypothetical protein L0387_19075 [Acidobacteria bacterium]|nr:hypothetical protein [Acidobacteriota bacterium]MCI0724224.1 hypothetical protein [Acidobacteriota bacterium]
MKRWTPVLLSICMTFGVNESGLLAKDRRGQGSSQGRGRGNDPLLSQGKTSRGNGEGTIDRDFGTDRAKEVGRGKKKGLYKDHSSIDEGRGKNHRNASSHKNDKDKVKKLHKEKKDKERDKD